MIMLGSENNQGRTTIFWECSYAESGFDTCLNENAQTQFKET